MTKATLIAVLAGALTLSAVACGGQATEDGQGPDEPQWVEAEAIAALATEFHQEDRRAYEIALEHGSVAYKPERPETADWSASYTGDGTWAVSTGDALYTVFESERPAILFARATATPHVPAWTPTPTPGVPWVPSVGDPVAADGGTAVWRSFSNCGVGRFSADLVLGGGTPAIVTDVTADCDTRYIQIELESGSRYWGLPGSFRPR